MGRGSGPRERQQSREDRGSSRKSEPYRFIYSPDAIAHLDKMTASQRGVVVNTVRRQLLFEPDVETKNRKSLRSNPIAPWELRIGKLRVFYDVDTGSERTVIIHAVGIKEHNRLTIGGEVVIL